MRSSTSLKDQMGQEWYKQVLEENSSFLVEKVSLTPLFMASLVSKKILSYGEVEDLEDEQIQSKRVWKFLKLLQKKSHRHFKSFIEVLKERGQTYVAAKLAADIKHKSKYTETERDAQKNINTYINDNLGPSSQLPIAQQRKLASDLVLQKDYMYMHSQNKDLLQEIEELDDELQEERKDHDITKNQLNDVIKQVEYQFDDLRTTKRQGKELQSKLDTAHKKVEHLQNENTVLQKEVKHKAEENSRLQDILSGAGTDMTGPGTDMTSYRLLRPIDQPDNGANDSDKGATATVPGVQSDTLEMKHNLESAKNTISHLQDDCKDIDSKLESKQRHLDKIRLQEKMCMEKLGLDLHANKQQIKEKIHSLISEGKMSKEEVDKIKKELSKVHSNKLFLKERVDSLKREKENLEFDMRHQDLTVKKIHHHFKAKETIKQAQCLLHAATNLQLKTQQMSKIDFQEVKRDSSDQEICKNLG